MNKLLYRIIFNKARGMLMVVADIARSGQGKQARARRTQQAASRICALSALRFSLLSALGCVSVLPVQAQIVANGQAPGNQQPTVVSSANGTTQVNIQTPSAGGVSRNNYSQFDVDQKGVILNNSHGNTKTQLGGMVTGNPWLARGEASVILNEVNSRNPSQLNGYVEVAGKKAQVVIANPSGITCDGCGFINANRATLTTGQAQVNNGNLTGYQVSGGEIVINGKGLDSRSQDYTDIIARTVKVNAGVWANDLKVTTGLNQVDAAHETLTATQADAARRPQVALDVAALGGMYASKIRLIGTEQGVGVRNAGALGATAGNFTLTSDGRIENSGSINGAQDIALTSQADIRNSGTVYAQRDSQLQAAGGLSNQGVIGAAGNNRIQAASLSNTSSGVLAAGMKADGSLGSQGDLNLTTRGQLTSNGRNLAAGNLNAQGTAVDLSGSQTYGNNINLTASTGDVSTRSATVEAKNSLRASSKRRINNDGGKIQADKLELTAPLLSNRQGVLSQLGESDLLLSHAAGIDNTSGTIASNGTNLTLNTGVLDNGSGRIQHAGSGQLNINASTLNGSQGSVITNGGLALRGDALNLDGATTAATQIRIDAGSLSHRQGEMVQSSNGVMTINVVSALDNSSGKIAGNGDVNLHAGSLNNLKGQVIAAGSGSLNAAIAQKLDNHSGTLAASQNLTVNAETLDNTAGAISAVAGNTQLTSQTLNNSTGKINAGQTLSVTSNGLNNSDGLLTGATTTLQLGSGTLNNQHGVIAAAEQLNVSSGLFDNTAGLVQSQGDARINTNGNAFINRDSGTDDGVIALGSLTLNYGLLDNRSGVINAQDLNLFNGDINNQQGLLAAQNALNITAGNIDNQQGNLIAGQALQLRSNELLNADGLIMSSGPAALATANLDNRQGKIGAVGDLTLNTQRLQNDNGGLIQSGAALSIDTNGQRLSNTNSGDSGGLISQGDMHLVAGELDNQHGALLASGAINLASGEFLNQFGQITGLGGITAQTQAVNNQQGNIQSGGVLDWNTQGNAFNNADGLLSAQGDFTLRSGDLNNRAGQVISGSDLTLSSADIDNTDGTLASKDDFALVASTLTNLRGAVQAAGNMVMTLVNSFTNQGNVQANGDLTLASGGDIRNEKLIQAGETLHVSAANLVNLQDAELSGYTTLLDASDTLTNYGLIDGYNTRLNGETVSNIGSGRIYGDFLSIQAGTLNNLAQDGVAATIAARQRLDLGVGTLNNRDHALIYSDGVMSIGGTLDANGQATGQAGTLNNHSATIESAGDMLLNVASLNNINDNFETELVEVSRENIEEYQVSGNANRYGRDEVSFEHKEVDFVLTPDYPWQQNDINDNWYRYQYERTVDETRIKTSDPGRIIAGGNLTINADNVLNDKSQIVAGNNLVINADTLDNVEVAGERHITDVGTAFHYWRIHEKGGDSQGRSTADYTPPTVIQSITLKPSTIEEHQKAEGSGLVIDNRTGGSVGDISLGDLSAGAAFNPGNAVLLPPGKTFEVPVNTAADGDAASSVIRTQGPNTRLPDNSLYKTNPTGGDYLIETDPRFTNTQKWLGSDYMMQAFVTNPDNVHKRLGDAYYEQNLIRQQMINLTGQRYLDGYDSDQEQYKALMDAGIAFGKQFNLLPGMALTAEQMSLMTGDMVWLVTQTVTLPDGSQQQVLVPQLFAKVQPGDLDGSGALLAGKNVSLNLSGDLNNSGRINARANTQVVADNINNLGGLIQGDSIGLQARTDINNFGGVLKGTSALTALAGRDINVTTATRTAESADGNFARTSLDSIAGIYVEKGDGTLALQAGRDVNLTAAQVVNSSENGSTVISAGRDLNLNAVTTGSRDDLNFDGSNWLHQSSSTQLGTEIAGKGNIGLAAGNNLLATAANVSAGNQLALSAGNDLSIVSGESRTQMDEHTKASGSSGIASKSTRETYTTLDARTSVGSSLSGDSVQMLAGHDLLVKGSDVAGTQDVRLAAGNNLTVTSAAEQRDESRMIQEKKSGLSGTGGIGVSYGSNAQKSTTTTHTDSVRGSTVGSVQGNLTMQAGSDLLLHGSDAIAGKDLTLAGKNVTVSAAEQGLTQRDTYETKQSGLTLALSGVAGGALNTAVTTARDAREESSGRLQALKGVQAALTGVQAAQATQPGAASQDNAIGVSLSYGSQQSKSETNLTQQTHQGSTLTAGNNLNVIAGAGDISVQGSQLQAGKDVLLNASRDISLTSSQETERSRGTNSSSGGSLGVGFGTSSDGSGGGFNVSASINKGKGHENSDSLSHSETQVTAGNRVTLVSGRDTTLTGAQVSGESIKADVGRNLTLTSEQDSATYDAQQKNSSAGASFSFGSMTGSASVNMSKDKMHSDYRSVQEQTGLLAGKGGFDVTVGGHTQLNGAVIGSTADAGLNRLDTGTLGFSDIHNSAAFKTEHQSVGISTGPLGGTGGVGIGAIGSQFAGNLANNLQTGANNSGSADSTTKAAVSDGTIVIRDQASQKQDVADLSRDVENANPGLGQIFDKEKEQNRLKEAQLIGEIGNQAADIARTQGQIAAAKAATDKMKDVTPEQLQAAQDEWSKANPGKTPTAEDISGQAYQNFYNEAFTNSGFGTGGKVQQAIQAATAAVQGLAGGDIGKALAGGSAPYLATVVKNTVGEDNPAANLMAHAAINAALALAKGENAAAGAAGAAIGEAMGMIAKSYYDKPVSELSETEKQTVSALATLAAGLAGGLAGGSTADAVAGAQAGKTTVENNALSDIIENKASGISQEEKYQNAQNQLKAAVEEFKTQNCTGISPDACSAKMEIHRNELLAGFAAAGLDFVPVVGDIKSFAEAQGAIDYLAAMVGIIPGAGDVAAKAIKGAQAALKKGDVAEASKLINQASNEVSAYNVAAYPKLKDDLIKQNLDNIAKQDSRLAAVVKGDNGKLNYGVGAGTQKEATQLGKIWVGDGAIPTTDGKGLVSSDGLRVYRYPDTKPNAPEHLNPTGIQANFETYKINPSTGERVRIGNGHMSINK
ncbi:hemagglutinin repeat-containing protein [Pantoea sp. BIGb0393]|uniref:Hemagglutinin repeat-containing protein n=1 Tax=Pantoea nemavictus TaxID=2726955 RepID=A0ABU8PQ32_9GAMM|nr:hemagglutinin repeat-containing protein [Pantoea nemavictus]MBA0035795.1 hemagglutinin repeat-containing protein [Pantoea nemavictus]